MMVVKFILGPNNVNDKLCNELYRLGLPVEGKNEQTPEEEEDSVEEDSMKKTLQYMITSI